MSTDNQDSYKAVNNDGAYSGSEYESSQTQYAGYQGYQPDAQTQVADTYSGYDVDSEIEYEQPCPPIHGWLVLFLYFFIGLGSIISLIIDFSDYDFSSPAFITAAVVISDLAYLATGIITIIAFHKRHPDAVYLARLFIISCFIINLSALFINDSSLSSKELTSSVKSVIWCGIWFMFTYFSQQIKERIPTFTRQFKKRVFVLAALIYVPILSIFTYGYIAVQRQQANAQSDADNLSAIMQTISDNQTSDGRILITIPVGLTCEQEVTEDGFTVFTFQDTTFGNACNIVSEHDASINKAIAEEMFEGWKPQDATAENSTIIVDKEYKQNGNTYWYKKLKVDLGYGDTAYWDFTIAADGNSDKFYIISAYSRFEDAPAWAELSESVKFL